MQKELYTITVQRKEQNAPMVSIIPFKSRLVCLGWGGWGALCVTSFITRAHLNCTSANPKLTPPKPVPKQSLGYSPESSHST